MLTISSDILNNRTRLPQQYKVVFRDYFKRESRQFGHVFNSWKQISSALVRAPLAGGGSVIPFPPGRSEPSVGVHLDPGVGLLHIVGKGHQSPLDLVDSCWP